MGSLAFRGAPDLDIDAAWRRVSARVREPEVRVLPIRRPWGSIALRAAAAVALLVGGVAIWRGAASGGGPGVPEVRVVSTLPGQTDSVRLSDGTRIVVGPGSELIVPAGYGETARTVDLKGEALFDVIHDDQRPFTVRAGRALIEDIGTTFTVRNDDDGVVRVVVTSGSVRLQGVVLQQGDRGIVGPDGMPVAERAAATADDLAWMRGQLVFDDAPLARVRAGIRRWYGVEVLADSSLAGRHLTATFSGEPIQRVLDVIGLAFGARVERRGDTAVVRAR
jgi:transmembrane sensor